MNIEINPRKIFFTIIWIIVFLLCINLIVISLKYLFYHDSLYRMYTLFNFNAEMNIPTFFATTLLLISSILLFIISISQKGIISYNFHWKVLAIIFLYLSIDEFVTLHEHIIRPLQKLLNTSGVLYFAWIIPYSIFLLFLLITYYNFLKNLPKTTMYLFFFYQDSFSFLVPLALNY